MRFTVLTTLLLLSAVILAASFLPWASLQSASLIDPNISPLENLPAKLGVANGAFMLGPSDTFTAWQGGFRLGIYAIPNWIVVLGALLIPLGAYKPVIGITAALFGLIHLTIFSVTMHSLGAQFGIGYIATLVAYLAALTLLIQGFCRDRRSLPSSN
ncbi:hypothetical protein H6F90_15330 [Trichocoleus sp. FACHB-591]|uniref:hypothetical protein n=1 Tax=Trichocoleus sp. FACHB-591 TaxID=2692872 RepID=UPI0016866522|nr:hypothetical protein [Trichocoleus sp. FACHB-591]MBD2096510.1 hypothetical protein [Trichocoleus sp. FACHB-591]